MRRRVDSNLNSHLASLSIYVGASLKPDLTFEWVKAQLPNFVAFGALTEDEASQWRSRFARAEEAVKAPDSEVVDERTQARAAELLKETIESVRRREDESGAALARFHASLYAFKALGAVSEAEVSKWNDRVLQAIEEGRPEPKAKNRPYVAAEFRRVVVGPPQRLRGVRLTCAELYTDCVMLRWHRLVMPDELAEGQESNASGKSADEVVRRWGAVLELRDDLGTQYVAADPANEITGSREAFEQREPSPVWGCSVFVPAVPEEASSLTALDGLDEFRLSLGP